MRKLFLALFVVLVLGMMSTSVWAQWWEIDVEAMVAAVPPGDLPPHPYDDVWEDADTAPGLLVRVGMDVYFLIVATNDTDYPLWPDSWVVPDSLLMSGIHIEGLIPIGGIQDPDPLPPGGSCYSDELLAYHFDHPVTAVYNSGETETHLMGVLGTYEFRDVPEGSYEACSHSFWKNHPEKMYYYGPSDLIVTVFTSAMDLVGDDDTLMDALEYEGGEGLDGAARLLLREGVAALNNEALDFDDPPYYDYPWDYPYDHPDDIITEVNLALDAVAGETEEEHRNRILDLSEKLEGYNNGVCPLEGDYPPLVPADGYDYVNYTAVYEACSHGFWKNHPEEWGGLDYSPSDLIVAVFTSAVNFVGDDTLMDALEYGGGKGLDGAARILLRQGVAALLNEALDADDDDPWDYPYDYPGDVITEVNLALDAVAGETEKEHRRRILDLSEKLEGYNNGLCPLEGDD